MQKNENFTWNTKNPVFFFRKKIQQAVQFFGISLKHDAVDLI